MNNIQQNLALGLISLASLTGCAKYDIQKDYKQFDNLEGIVIHKSSNLDTLLNGVRIMTPIGIFEKYDKNLYDSTNIGSKLSMDCTTEYKTLILKKNKSNCNTKYVNITTDYKNIKIQK